MATKLAHPDKTPQTAWPDVAIPPGETLAEELAARRLSQTKLARRMGRPLQTVNMIVNGKKAITEETAIQLEKVLGVSATFWMNLQTNYNLTKARLAQRHAPRARADEKVANVLYAHRPGGPGGRKVAKRK